MGPQTGHLDRGTIDAYKQRMLDGSLYTDPRNKVAGYFDGRKLTVQDGHHRVQAGMELYNQTGNAYYLNELIRFSLKAYPVATGIPGVKPVQMPGPLQNSPPPVTWRDGPFPPA